MSQNFDHPVVFVGMENGSIKIFDDFERYNLISKCEEIIVFLCIRLRKIVNYWLFEVKISREN